MLLALETAFEFCSVCLYDEQSVYVEHKKTPRQQTQYILPMIESVLAEHNVSISELQAIAFNCGPGSFGGVRINTAVAQALGFAHDVPCVPISSLQAQAQAVFDSNTHIDDITIVNDAKMKEVYIARYKKNTSNYADLQGTESLLTYELAMQEDFASHIYGDGVCLLANKISSMVVAPTEVILSEAMHMTAEHLAKLGYYRWQNGLAVPAHEAQPVYLRNNAWQTLIQQKQNRLNKQNLIQ